MARSFLIGGARGVRTLATLSRPTPLAGEPLHHLGIAPYSRRFVFFCFPNRRIYAHRHFVELTCPSRTTRMSTPVQLHPKIGFVEAFAMQGLPTMVDPVGFEPKLYIGPIFIFDKVFNVDSSFFVRMFFRVSSDSLRFKTQSFTPSSSRI